MTAIQARAARRVAIAGAGALLFGIATISSGGNALFGSPEARAAVGNAVPFVLWFNFLAGFAYIVAGVGLLLARWWAAPLSVLIAAATLLVFGAFVVHVASGGAFEMRTVFAMILRSGIWGLIAVFAWRTLRGNGAGRAR